MLGLSAKQHQKLYKLLAGQHCRQEQKLSLSRDEVVTVHSPILFFFLHRESLQFVPVVCALVLRTVVQPCEFLTGGFLSPYQKNMKIGTGGIGVYF